MQIKFTVYNCGTGYNRNATDVIAQLNKETQSEHIINDGPGSGSKWHIYSKVGGLLGGIGVDANVQVTVERIEKFGEIKQMVVNM